VLSGFDDEGFSGAAVRRFEQESAAFAYRVQRSQDLLRLNHLRPVTCMFLVRFVKAESDELLPRDLIGRIRRFP
jgi:hypothetical protein